MWRMAKPHVRNSESSEGVLIVDDSIAEKPYTDVNDIIRWRYDHTPRTHDQGHQLYHLLTSQSGRILASWV